ncbi:MAG: cytochrome c [Gemmatimonadaceae bacterium]
MPQALTQFQGRTTQRVAFVIAVVAAFSTGTVHAQAAPNGAAIYAATCIACHMGNGQGVAGQFPPLVNSDWVLGSEERLIRIILHGVVGEIEVEGEMFNGAMPTWGPTFRDEDLAAVATYVRKSWGNKSAPVTAATVARVRLQHQGRTKPWTAAELLKK